MTFYKDFILKEMPIEKLRVNESFCTLAWTGLSVSPTGMVTPCCLFESPITDDDKITRIHEDDINTFYNGDFMSGVRKKMFSGEKVKGCRQCYENEAHGGYSMRMRANHERYEILEQYDLETPVVPVSLDLKLNNKCNLKCRMCQPQDSNLIYNEFSKILKKDKNFSNFSNTRLKDFELNVDLKEIAAWEDSEEFFDKFKSMLPSLKKISLVGGEPLILNIVYRLLDYAIETGDSKHIYIAITTNMMVVPEEKLGRYFESFESVLVNMSIDAVGTELNYIRYPSSYEKIIDNFKKLYTLAGKRRNIFFNFSMTIQAYNALYIVDILEEVEKLKIEGYEFRNCPFNFTYLYFPEHLSLRMLPGNIRERAIKKLVDYLERDNYANKFKRLKNDVQQLINYLKNDHLKNSLQLQREFLYYTETLDKERNQTFKTSLTELYQGFTEAGVVASIPVASYHKIREQGWELAKKGHLRRAIAKFKQSAELSEDKYLDYREMAWMMLSIRKVNDAYHAYQKAYSLNSEDKHIIRGLVITSFKKGDEQLASSLIDKSLHFFPEDKNLEDIKLKLFR